MKIVEKAYKRGSNTVLGYNIPVYDGSPKFIEKLIGYNPDWIHTGKQDFRVQTVDRYTSNNIVSSSYDKRNGEKKICAVVSVTFTSNSSLVTRLNVIIPEKFKEQLNELNEELYVLSSAKLNGVYPANPDIGDRSTYTGPFDQDLNNILKEITNGK